MPIDKNTIEQLLHEEEGSALDFKRDQYSFDGADNNAKSELLKDILAFANAWRRTIAYILIGVDDVKGGRSKLVGIKAHLDDAKLHQFVNSKIQRPIEFSYQPFRAENVEIGVIEIPIQERPFYLKKQFGKLRKNVVYKRDGSSTAIAAPDEVARMGAEQNLGGTPQLVLGWADIDKRVVLTSPHTVSSLFLNPQLPFNTFESPRSPHFLDIDIHRENKNYSKEIICYTFQMAFLKPFYLRLFNNSGIAGKKVFFVGSVNKDKTVRILDCSNQPMLPQRRHRFGLTSPTFPIQGHPDPCVQELSDRWEITIDFGDVRPREEVWATSALLIGSRTGITRLEGQLHGDNIPDPISCVLKVNFEVHQRPMEISDVESYLDAE